LWSHQCILWFILIDVAAVSVVVAAAVVAVVTAEFRVTHLKQFLCSKYDIDAQNKQVEVEVTYEDEVLPPTHTLMDIGYCYHWDRVSKKKK